MMNRYFKRLLCGIAFCAAFGFVQGALTLLASALLTGGVGPWLPFQMLAAAWVGFLAGCLPPARGRRELVILAAYGACAGLLYGLVMDMWFWPFATDGTRLGFVPGAPVAENLGRFWAFHLATALGFDIPRAVATAVLVLVAGGAVLGGKLYGTFPSMSLGGPDDSGSRGAMIPSTSIDQYGATMASWFGVPAGSLPSVFPNIGNFPVNNLGFLN